MAMPTDGMPVDKFDMAVSQTRKAWTSTPMLARISLERATDVVSKFNEAPPSVVAEMLLDMIGQAWASASVQVGLDSSKMAKLGRFAVEMAIQEVDLRNGSSRRESFVEEVLALFRAWVADEKSAGENLLKADRLMKMGGAGRLLLISPFIPALVASQQVISAHSNKYPFRDISAEREKA